jgi:hypothetical protein
MSISGATELHAAARIFRTRARVIRGEHASDAVAGVAQHERSSVAEIADDERDVVRLIMTSASAWLSSRISGNSDHDHLRRDLFYSADVRDIFCSFPLEATRDRRLSLQHHSATAKAHRGRTCMSAILT